MECAEEDSTLLSRQKGSQLFQRSSYPKMMSTHNRAERRPIAPAREESNSRVEPFHNACQHRAGPKLQVAQMLRTHKVTQGEVECQDRRNSFILPGEGSPLSPSLDSV